MFQEETTHQRADIRRVGQFHHWFHKSRKCPISVGDPGAERRSLNDEGPVPVIYSVSSYEKSEKENKRVIIPRKYECNVKDGFLEKNGKRSFDLV